MKKVHLLIITGIILIIWSCCKKDDPVTVKDIDGNVYKTIKIGTQLWMAENLKVTRYRNGDVIPNVTNDSTWMNLKTGASSNCFDIATYGLLYNWYAVHDSRNIAPKGWHVPTDAEWTTLINYLGGSKIAGDKMKETGTIHWDLNLGGTNESGFTALPGGMRHSSPYGSCGLLSYSAYWWSATEYDNLKASYVCISKDDGVLGEGDMEKEAGLSIRCVIDK